MFTCFALKCKHLYRIDPTYFIGLAPGRRAEVGQGQYQEKYRAEGGGRRADGGRQTEISFYSFLVIPHFEKLLRTIFASRKKLIHFEVDLNSSPKKLYSLERFLVKQNNAINQNTAFYKRSKRKSPFSLICPGHQPSTFFCTIFLIDDSFHNRKKIRRRRILMARRNESQAIYVMEMQEPY